MKKYWYYHAESESHFIVEGNDNYVGDGLCEFIGEAFNDTYEDFLRAQNAMKEQLNEFRKNYEKKFPCQE